MSMEGEYEPPASMFCALDTLTRTVQCRSFQSCRTPRNESEQSDLNRQPQPQHPDRHWKQFRPLQHVDVSRRDRKSQQEQSDAGGSARRRPQQPQGTQQLERSTDEHRRSGPRDVRRNDAHLGAGRREMRDAANEEPKENEPDADALCPGRVNDIGRRGCEWRSGLHRPIERCHPPSRSHQASKERAWVCCRHFGRHMGRNSPPCRSMDKPSALETGGAQAGDQRCATPHQ